MKLEFPTGLAPSISARHIPSNVTADSWRSVIRSAAQLWRVLVRLAVAGLCLLCLSAANSTAPAVAPAAFASASSVSSAFLATLTDQERAWLRAHPVIRVVQDPDWPPIEFADQSGNPTGMTKDYLNLIEQRLGQKFEPVLHLSWQEALTRMKRGEIDMTTSVAETPDRLEFLAFTKPYMTIPIVIATQQNVTYIGNLHELAGKKVAAVDGFAVNEWMLKDFPEVRLLKVKSSLEGLQRLQRGEVDAVIDSLVTIGHHQANRDVLNLKVAGATPYFNAQRMAVRKDWAPLAGILQKALDSITEPERDEIFRRWLPIRYEHGFDYTLLWQALAGFAVILLGLALWNRQLSLEIRARKLAQSALIESEENLAITVNSIGDAVIATDALGLITRMNPVAERLTGWPLAEALGKPLTEVFRIISAETRMPSVNPVQLVMAHGKVVDLANHTALLARDGHEYQIADSAAPIRKATGEIVGVVLVFSDVTEKYRNEEALRQSESLRGSILDSVSAEIAVLNREGIITAVNAPWLRFASENSLTPGQLAPHTGVGSNYLAVCVADNADLANTAMNARQGIQAVIDGRLPSFSLEYPCHSSNKQRWFSLSATPLGDTGMGAVLSHTNITSRKVAEESLRIAATVFESQQGMVVTDAQRVILRVNPAFTQITGYSADEAVGQTPRLLKSGRHDSAFYAAMTNGLENEGAWVGEIWNRRKSGEVYPEWLTISAVKDKVGQATHFVAIFSDISDRVEAQSQIDTLAFYDPLTHLPNRRLLLDRLEQALHTSTRHARNSALLFVDLDNFKILNDTLGHHQGDLLLVQVAQRLKACVRDGDSVARLGSDEFVVMLEDLSENDIEAATQAETVGHNVLDAFQQDFQLDSGAHHSTPSIGITMFGGEALEGSEQPLKRAELAMFQAKAAGRNTLRFFDAKMQAEVSAHAALEADLRDAVQRQQFLLYYQPQVVGAGRINGVEALVRWLHPQRGMVSPAQFIPLAEENGLILPIGQWVLETACAQLTAWSTQPALAHLTVAVNVSARQFKQSNFVDSVLATLTRTGANPKRLKLELTESMLVDDVEAIIAKMGALKAQGVAFSLDDFGTGYSSLAYLKRLPLDQLKIDQGFIRNIVTDSNDAAIAKMVVALAESMGLAVIAEGVELQAQADFLAHLGCHAYQGYLFSKPLPLDALEAFARGHYL